MRKIRVEEAVVGEVVAAPVTNQQGRVILPVGAKLSAAVLSRLSGWGVHELAVEGEEEECPASGKKGAMAALDARFADWEEDALMMQIKAIACDHLQRL